MNTKKSIYFLFVLLILSVSCNKSEDFLYDKKLLVGTWELTKLSFDDRVDEQAAVLTFKEDGTFKVIGPIHGIFGNGSGVYRTYGDIIECDIDASKVTKNQVIQLTDTLLELSVMRYDGSYGLMNAILKRK